MHRGRPMGESFDHRPTGGIRQSSKCCTQLIHNHMVVDFQPMSNVNFASRDFCPESLNPDSCAHCYSALERAGTGYGAEGQRYADCLWNLLGVSPPLLGK